jgi:hypothetical protein
MMVFGCNLPDWLAGPPLTHQPRWMAGWPTFDSPPWWLPHPSRFSKGGTRPEDTAFQGGAAAEQAASLLYVSLALFRKVEEFTFAVLEPPIPVTPEHSQPSSAAIAWGNGVCCR